MPFRPSAALALLLPLALAGLGAVPATTAAQEIVGQVVDDATADPLEGVHVVLLDTADARLGAAFSDARGHFRLEVPYSGTWSIRASIIGYGEVASDPLEIDPVERVAVQVRMTVEAVAIDEPVVVTSRITPLNADLRGFYDRMQRGDRSGMGTFVSREDVERIRPLEASDLLRTTGGVHIVRGPPGRGRGVRMAGGCVPAIYIDGAFINRWDTADSLDDYVAATTIEGIEVYRGLGQVGRFHDPRGCGLVLVWTRRGAPPADESGSWFRYAVGASLLLGILLLR